ncbi:hypothetical protein [Nocardia arthritidis]|uniref:Uncharacterized protein n=1 Tax=Nocardia arthritidis TaxID=228602 RepID=A0A6G9YTC1_9NOCA|nr:hypothetical protein [Nocardia arthritidis]QIS16569.1 hypothetical protein F5544_43830 [Nocardia arthritidis]
MTAIFRLWADIGTSWTDILVPKGSELVWARTEYGKTTTYWCHEGDHSTAADEPRRVRFDSMPLPPNPDPIAKTRGVSGLPGSVPFVKESTVLWVYKPLTNATVTADEAATGTLRTDVAVPKSGNSTG